MSSLAVRQPRNTGPIELRDFGPEGRRLGTAADCFPGSRWELHRGELVEQMGSKDLHGIAMAIAAALFRAHARPGHVTMTDVYCDLSDEQGPSLRAPDVVLARDLVPRNDVYAGTPVVAVEVRGTQSKKYLGEKVRLFLQHDWPLVWVLHVEQSEVEVFEAGEAPRRYMPEETLPLPAALDEHGLTAVPVRAFFDDALARRHIGDWVRAQGHAEGRSQGLAEGLRLAVADLAEVLGVELDQRRRTELELLDADALTRLREQLKRDRRW